MKGVPDNPFPVPIPLFKQLVRSELPQPSGAGEPERRSDARSPSSVLPPGAPPRRRSPQEGSGNGEDRDRQ